MPTFTTDFHAVPAAAVTVRGLPAAPPARRDGAQDILSSLSGVFAVSADTLRLISDLVPRDVPFRRAA